MQNTHAMQELSICIVFIAYLGKCSGCSPLTYIPPPAELESVKQSEETQCTDCTRSQARFFFGLPCCTESPRAGLKRMQNETDCGRKGGTAPYLHKDDENTKIVGGVPALENEFPWQVAVMTQNDTWRGCGAILLSCDPVIVVSAAHCFKPFLSPPGGIKLAFGAQNMGTGTPVLDTNEVRLDVEEVIIHPSFSPITIHAGISGRNNLNVNIWENDIAVIKIKNGTNLNCEKRTIWPACLPNKEFEYGGWNRTVVTGWGRTDVGNVGNASTVLRKARIPIVTDEQCLKNFLQDVPDVPEEAEDLFNPEDLVRLADTKICAGDIESGLGFCQGDSGGPLVAQDEASMGWSAVGIVSYLPVSQEPENPACGGNRYGVFTEVGKYLDWIGEQFDLLPPEKIY